MPDPKALTLLQAAWLEFADSSYLLFVPDLTDDPLYQYVQFRDNVYAVIKSDDFLDGLEAAWTNPNEPTNKGIPANKVQTILNLLIIELRAFSNGIRAEGMPVEFPKKKDWLRKWLGRAGSVAGSVKELPEKLKLPWYVESGLIAFKELTEAFQHN